MTSLNAVVPDDTSHLWRSSWPAAISDKRFMTEMRVRHVAIRDSVKVIDAKGEHVVRVCVCVCLSRLIFR